MATHGFAAAKPFAAAKRGEGTVHTGQNFIFFLKVPYSCTDCLETLINDQWGPNKNETKWKKNVSYLAAEAKRS